MCFYPMILVVAELFTKHSNSYSRWCSEGFLMAPCPAGHYCPAGTEDNWEECPPGTYNDDTGLATSGECKPCPPGKYCDR